jgi:hypothetical protein
MSLAATQGACINCNDLFHFYSFDVLGDLAFGRSFDMLLDQKYHHAVTMMQIFMSFLGPFTPVPWLSHIGFGLPWVTGGWTQFLDYCKSQMAQRISVG